MESIRKAKINRAITIVSVLFALLGAFSLYQVLNWNLFPWLKLSIIFGSSFLCLIFALVVKIYSREISYLILVTALIQFLTSALLLSQHEILRAYWQWMFFPLTVIFSMIFWDLFSRKRGQINFYGRIACCLLLVLAFLKFFNPLQWIDYSLIGIVSIVTLTLIFSKSRNFQES